MCRYVLFLLNLINFFFFFLLDKSTTTNIADFIQPSLGQLQPNLDEFMDTIEPLQGTYNTMHII